MTTVIDPASLVSLNLDLRLLKYFDYECTPIVVDVMLMVSTLCTNVIETARCSRICGPAVFPPSNTLQLKHPSNLRRGLFITLVSIAARSL